MKISKLLILTFTMTVLINCEDRRTSGTSDLRIIALSPSLVETVFFLGGGKNIVGASSFCNYPEEAKNIPVVANVSDINLEYAVKLKPDIVLLMPGQDNIAAKLNLLNIKTLKVSQEKLDDILNSFTVIGREIGREQRALAVKDSLNKVLESYKKPANNKTVLISAGREYGTGITYIFSNGHTGFLNDIIKLMGYSNALDTAVPYPKIGAETVMTLDPDIIIDLVPSDITSSTEELLKDWELFRTTKAWKNDAIFILKGDHTTIPGPRIFDLIKELNEKGL
ncbi:TPA: hypothetical protein DCR49_11115 [Candidatus Delongbacteria bacterium]|nr:MAG: hypothetical protein A2Y39_01380 [Candidatus Delongbacteria bacterium GWF2_40_14]HAQ62523.1 hypothetical protein [Candidatus Delongbacteria bacterium]